ncbi:hypothetical protein ARMGADRAFT_1011591 [Armillaria gallica]|uniref:Uncharacterized protein n=1 Tax=Armillaria gallica TaxID=47427 RepID=A0A2H3DV19_ARMGA|nr:hypothetical protein ARMGADRAFT_1011591 [Armillaria gallica]
MPERTNGTSLVGSVFERPPSLALHRPPQPSKTGFPAAQHRSKSALARRRDEERKTDHTRPRSVPTVVQPFAPNVPRHEEEPVADWREDTSRQNQLQVQNMTAEERERERNETYKRFGADIGGILRRAREARERQAEKDSEEMKRKRPEGTPITDLFTSSRRNAEKGLPEVPITSEMPTSRPVSPPLASFPPSSLSASATRPSTPSKGVRTIRFAELSPTDVHVYESAPPSPRKKTVLALPPLPPAQDPEGSPEYIRRKYFPSAPSSNPDLAWMNPSTSDDKSDDSSPLDKLRSTLPTHLGLHHHAEGSHAGYTLDDVFLLTRAAMLGVLSGGGNDPSATLLKRIFVGARGIAVVWQCLIDDLQVDLNDIELNMPVDVSTATTTTPPPSISSLIDALLLSEMLSQLAPLLSSPPDFNSLLGIIVQTSSLVASIVNVFLLSAATPHPPAIHSLITLVHASRRNAKALCDPADAMLKFIASTIPSTDGTAQYPAELALELLYGMYSHTATDAQTLWTRLTVYLAQAWSELIGTWMICATDPHKTSPSHDILWSQVVAWGWGEDDKSQLKEIIDTQSAIWRCISAWLEGSRVNSPRGGQAEREAVLTGGLARHIADLAWLPTLLTVIRLWLACIPSSSGPPESPPFDLPFSRISQLCALLVSHPHRGLVGAYARVMCRPLASLLYYHLLFSDDLWMAQAFAIILRCYPGDEGHALAIMDDLLGMITADWAKQRQLKIPNIIWERGGMNAIKPILHQVIQPRDDVQTAPTSPTSKSILLSTSQRLTTSVLITTDWDPIGLPLKGDWALTPIDHLSAFQRKGAFPLSWDASETEILGREAVLRFASGLADVVLSGPEAVFGCMKGQDEVFRDPAVGYLMNELLSPYAVGMQLKVKTVAARFLGAGTPFYQYYTDFVALYDAISFAHPLFARLLLPPTSMHYAVDYRKHLWLDFGHLIKSIYVPLDAVISQDIREYLYPVEHSSEMISAYLRALVTIGPSMDGFVRFVAVHHVACNIWPDLMVAPGDDVSSKKLFGLLIGQGSEEVLREILTFKQAPDGPVSLAPLCFEHGSEVKRERADYILRWTDLRVLEKLLALS